MADKSISLQDLFLNSIRKSKTPATVFLMKGVKLQGIVTWFDAFSILLQRDGISQLVYKHSISTIMPNHAPEDLPRGIGGEGSNGRKPGLQDLFLAAAGRQSEHMTVFLVNGVMLQGQVAGFDQFSMMLERSGQVQLVYKHAISTIQPENPLDLGSADDSGGEQS